MSDGFFDEFENDDLAEAFVNTACEIWRRGLPLYRLLAEAKARQIMRVTHFGFEDQYYEQQSERPS